MPCLSHCDKHVFFPTLCQNKSFVLCFFQVFYQRNKKNNWSTLKTAVLKSQISDQRKGYLLSTVKLALPQANEGGLETLFKGYIFYIIKLKLWDSM